MSITPYKWGWGEAGEAVAFWGFIGGGATPVTPVIGGGITYRYSDKKQREKREENEVLMFIKEFLRIQGRG